MDVKKNDLINEFKKHYTPRLRILAPWFSNYRYFNLSYQLAFTFLLISIISIILAVQVGYRIALQEIKVPYLQNLLHSHNPSHSDNVITNEQITKQLGRIEANLMRVNALGEQLVMITHLDPKEFDFNAEVAQGGPENTIATLTHLESLLDKRYSQLSTINEVIHQAIRQYELSFSGSGKVVNNGWISSFFGTRFDPFTGRRAWHGGIDIVGKEGAPITALASGVVAFARTKGGYGKVVEIDHGNGLSTLYGHNKAILVREGELVRKGQTVALLGSTGRSTGPHLHLEVHKDGKAVDPGYYFKDLRRKTS